MITNNKILIIEDDMDFAAGLSNCLESSGLEVKHVKSVEAALKIIPELRPNGITLDMQLEDEFGYNLLKVLTVENSYIDYVPAIIVVSSMVNARLLRILQEYQIPHYNKIASNFEYRLVAEMFSAYLTTYSFNNSSIINNMSKENEKRSGYLPEGKELRTIIYKHLRQYNLNIKVIAYERLVDGIFYTLQSDEPMNLTKIYLEITNVDYHTAFSGIRKLIIDSFKNNPSSFFNHFHKKTKEEIIQDGTKMIPTPNEFIYHIVSLIREKYH